MKSLIVFAFLTAFMYMTSAAQDEKMITGYLVDKMCASGMVKNSPAVAMEKAAKHTRSCAMEKDCAAAGYGVVTDDGKWTKFDAKGNDLAADFLKHTKQKDHLLVSVTGTTKGDVFAVNSLKGAKPAQKKEMKKDGL